MTLREYVQMEKLIHGREIPADILYQMTSDNPDNEYMYYSESKGSLISILICTYIILSELMQNKVKQITMHYKKSYQK